MFIGNEHILTKIESAEFEKNIINGGKNNEDNSHSIRQ